ncbi:MAG: class I SAM-dependent methyltransferase [Persicimonas sp.]
MTTQTHWQDVYQGKSPDEQSWYQRRPDVSLELIDEVATGESVRLIDVGGGASTLVDHLLDRDRFEVTVVDIASAALEATKERLGGRAGAVEWVVADVTEPLEMDGPFDLWHDRAVFHFLTDERDRDAYLANLERVVAPQGRLVMSTFAPWGPETCSGLPVRRYSPESLGEELGRGWRLVDSRREEHQTPWGGTQAFIYGVFERAAET